MRLQTMYVDMRPTLTKWLGLLCVAVCLLLLFISLRPDFVRTAQTLKLAYAQSRTGTNGPFNFGYLNDCLRSAECVQQFLVSWSAPLIIKAFILGGLAFGLISAGLGLVWRPEVVAMRDTRINATNVEASKLNSPRPPRRNL